MGQLRTTNKRHKRAVTAAAKPMAPAPKKAKPAAKKGK